MTSNCKGVDTFTKSLADDRCLRSRYNRLWIQIYGSTAKAKNTKNKIFFLNTSHILWYDTNCHPD
jgi:hypothetical protein